MTGFGKGEAVVRHKKITVEIRSLNSKQLDLNLRLPALYRRSENELRGIVTRSVRRGKVDLFVTVESTCAETPARIDRELFRSYLRQLTDALTYAGIDASYDALVPAVLRMPEVVASDEETVSDEEHAALLTAAEAAVEALDAFRRQEGAILIADLVRRVNLIESYREQIEPYDRRRAETIRARILEQLDITEEKVRLKNHCRYFREVAAEEEEAGRKLGFIAQEMGREINTTGSKANDTEIQILVVKMKDELEKIKEQVLNIL